MITDSIYNKKGFAKCGTFFIVRQLHSNDCGKSNFKLQACLKSRKQ